MTSNQIAREANEETKRANQAKEKEATRSNKARERETYRSNRAGEKIKQMSNVLGAVNTGLNALKQGTEPLRGMRNAASSMISALNDPSWYNRIPGLITTGSYFPMSHPAGTPFSTGTSVFAMKSYFYENIAVYKVDFCLPATAQNATDPINAAMFQLYSWVRHANSGSKVYEAVDYIMYLIGMSSCYAWASVLERLYGALNTFNPLNYNYAKRVVESMGFNYEDLSSHIADLRTFINQYKYNLSQWYTPADMPIFARQYWMFSGIYKDAENDKAQLYMFVPSHLFKVSAVEGATKLVPYEITSREDDWIGAIDFTRIQSITNDLLTGIAGIEDIGIMSGDTKKAFGDRTHTLSPVPVDYKLNTAYSEEVLNQFHNATIFNGVNDTEITQVDGFIHSAPYYYAQEDAMALGGESYYADDAVIDVREWKEVTNEMLTVFTRLTGRAMSNGIVADSIVYYLDVIGTEIISDVILIANNDNFTHLKGAVGIDVTSDNDALTKMVDVMASRAHAESFEYAPGTKVVVKSGENQYIAEWLQNKTNYASISPETLKLFHRAAIQSLFSTPETISQFK